MNSITTTKTTTTKKNNTLSKQLVVFKINTLGCLVTFIKYPTHF